MDKTTDRYVHALSGNWRTEVIDRKVEQYNEQRRQMALEANRLRIQLELGRQKLYSHNKGRKTVKSEEIRQLCAKYPYGASVYYRVQNGGTAIRKVISTWHINDRGKPVCNARTKDGKKTVLSADRIIKRKTRKEDNV